MSKYANKNIVALTPYKPPLENRRGFVGHLFDFNERNAPVSPKVTEALIDFVKNGRLELYPEYGTLYQEVAEYAGVEGSEVILTNGSDQALDIIFRTFTEKGDKVILPAPSFAMFYQHAGITGNEIIQMNYKEDMSFPLEELLNAITADIRMLVVCNPNNPTGTTLDLETIEQILEKALSTDTVVLLDEAYYEFSKITAAKLINKYPNLIITRTFSKAFGLSSLRIGYALSCEENTTQLLKVRGPYDVTMPAIIAAAASLSDLPHMEAYVEEVKSKSKPLIENFLTEKGIKFYPSTSNFILLKPENAEELYSHLKEKGFMTRPMKGPNIEGCLRLSLGTEKQMQKFIEANHDL